MDDENQPMWGDVLYLGVVAAAFALAVWILRFAGAIPQFKLADFFVVFGALLALEITEMFNIRASNGHAYHRLGVEISGLTLGTCISLVTVQIWCGRSVLPKLGDALFHATLSHANQEAIVMTLALVSVLVLGVTSDNVRKIEEKKKKSGSRSSGLSFFSFLLGMSLLLAYTLLMVGAGS